MKIKKSRISIIIFSICFLLNKTEILHTMNGKHLAEPIEVKGKDAPSKGGNPKTTRISEVPDAVRKPTTAPEYKTSTATGNKATEGRMETTSESINLTQSRPTTPNEFTANKNVQKTMQADKSINLSELELTDNTAALENQVEATINLFETAKTTSGRENLFEPEKIIEPKNEIEKTTLEKSDANTKNNILSQLIESFNKIIESFTRTWNQDSTTTSKQRTDLKIEMNNKKETLKKAREQFNKLQDNPNITAEQIAELENNIKNQLAEVLMRAKPDSTIYKDLSKALDDLDPTTAQEIKDSAAKEREKLVSFRAKDANIQDQIDTLNNKYNSQYYADLKESNRPLWQQAKNDLELQQRNNKNEALGYNYYEFKNPFKEAIYDNISPEEISEYRSKNPMSKTESLKAQLKASQTTVTDNFFKMNPNSHR